MPGDCVEAELLIYTKDSGHKNLSVEYKCKEKKDVLKAGKRAQQIKAFSAKPDDLHWRRASTPQKLGLCSYTDTQQQINKTNNKCFIYNFSTQSGSNGAHL